MSRFHPNLNIAIACGGTGGHLFPGLAVGRALARFDCRVSLFVSTKGIDQKAVAGITDLSVVTLPAVALQDRNYLAFVRSMRDAWLASRAAFARNKPGAVLAMGGFTSFPVVMAGTSVGAASFLHESNTIPGRANRLLAHWVDECFVGFPEAADRLWNPRVTWTGTPARDGFAIPNPTQIQVGRQELGLDPARPVLLVTGGSQGARGLNRLFLAALPELVTKFPELQYIHLTGEGDFEAARIAHTKLACRSVVQPFLAGMTSALAAATAVVSRAGASSIAELAAVRAPSLLVPLPTAQDNHQYYNALALESSGAALMRNQESVVPGQFAQSIVALLSNPDLRRTLSDRIGAWHVADAAERIAARMLQTIGADQRSEGPNRAGNSSPGMQVARVKQLGEVAA